MCAALSALLLACARAPALPACVRASSRKVALLAVRPPPLARGGEVYSPCTLAAHLTQFFSHNAVLVLPTGLLLGEVRASRVLAC